MGFFVKNETHIPYDFHEILAAISPRPLLIVAPAWDQYASLEDIKRSVSEATRVYSLTGSEDKIQLQVPEDYNRFSSEMKDRVLEWVNKNFR